MIDERTDTAGEELASTPSSGTDFCTDAAAGQDASLGQPGEAVSPGARAPEAHVRQPPHAGDAESAETGGEAQTAEPAGEAEPVEMCATAIIEHLEARLAAEVERVREHERQVAMIRQAHAESVAEFEKTKMRQRRLHTEEVERSRLAMASSLFGVWDNLALTLSAARRGGGQEAMVEGVSMVLDQFRAVLAEFKVESYSPAGELFDPEIHEAMGVVPTPDPAGENTVVAVLRPGFRAGEKILRAAVVMVGKYQPPPPVPAASPVDGEAPHGDEQAPHAGEAGAEQEGPLDH